jgi:hypothetical protein
LPKNARDEKAFAVLDTAMSTQSVANNVRTSDNFGAIFNQSLLATIILNFSRWQQMECKRHWLATGTVSTPLHPMFLPL